MSAEDFNTLAEIFVEKGRRSGPNSFSEKVL
jgi:hypothetical protein